MFRFFVLSCSLFLGRGGGSESGWRRSSLVRSGGAPLWRHCARRSSCACSAVWLGGLGCWWGARGMSCLQAEQEIVCRVRGVVKTVCVCRPGWCLDRVGVPPSPLPTPLPPCCHFFGDGCALGVGDVWGVVPSCPGQQACWRRLGVLRFTCVTRVNGVGHRWVPVDCLWSETPQPLSSSLYTHFPRLGPLCIVCPADVSVRPCCSESNRI